MPAVLHRTQPVLPLGNQFPEAFFRFRLVSAKFERCQRFEIPQFRKIPGAPPAGGGVLRHGLEMRLGRLPVARPFTIEPQVIMGDARLAVPFRLQVGGELHSPQEGLFRASVFRPVHQCPAFLQVGVHPVHMGIEGGPFLDVILQLFQQADGRIRVPVVKVQFDAHQLNVRHVLAHLPVFGEKRGQLLRGQARIGHVQLCFGKKARLGRIQRNGFHNVVQGFRHPVQMVPL
ncbi:MAG: hypothetical protein BWY09_02303 [Candidatus Hydrogenedentes bacterium ADurb.Bin179]|nr:MAG: hypothetical protein BWY09_02303 [Candidatus Hydrogenedentes bacterium ADurb.Bin179]